LKVTLDTKRHSYCPHSRFVSISIRVLRVLICFWNPASPETFIGPMKKLVLSPISTPLNLCPVVQSPCVALVPPFLANGELVAGVRAIPCFCTVRTTYSFWLNAIMQSSQHISSRRYAFLRTSCNAFHGSSPARWSNHIPNRITAFSDSFVCLAGRWLSFRRGEAVFDIGLCPGRSVNVTFTSPAAGLV
jgi:hypothetical protein